MNAVVPAEQTRDENVHVYKPSKMLDPKRFEYLWRLTEIIASSEIVPLSLKAKKKPGARDWEALTEKTVLANVFLVVEQADRWGISPFALIQASSIVHGKLCFEGKVIMGVLQEIGGINLKFDWNGKIDDSMGCRITGMVDGQECVWPPKDSGKDWVTVAEWKTTGEGSPWTPKNYARQMMYRGSREWTRLYKPSILIGVFSEDEIEEIGFEAAAQSARTIKSAAERRAEATPADTGNGFSADNVTRALPDQRQVPMEDLSKRPEPEKVPAETGSQKETNSKTEADPPKNTAGSNASDVDRNGPGTADSTATAGQPSDASKADGDSGAGGAVETGGGNAPSAAGSFDYKGYSSVLNRATQQKSLRSLDAEYRSKHAWTTEEAALPTLRKVYDVHLRRIKGELDQKMMAAELTELGAL